MKYPIYAIRDVKSTFTAPTIDFCDATAMRNFCHAIKNSSDVMHSHPQDFSLWKVGEFDNETGAVSSVFPLELIMEGENVK